MIYIESKRRKVERLIKKYPNAIIADVTSKSDTALIKLSPFYPWGDIPVPYTPNMVATCVEAVWQGLKVFENSDVDVETFKNDTMRGLKRTSKKYGKILGHRRGVYGDVLFDYLEARKRIFIRSYRWMLENKALYIIERMRVANKNQDIVLLDYETNCDITNVTKPLSHAYLVKAYVEGIAPYEDVKEKIVHHHYYTGKRTISWTTEEEVFKQVQPQEQKDAQLSIEFDF
jgi:hypothetical protein